MDKDGAIYIPVDMDVSRAEKNWAKFVKKLQDSEVTVGELQAKIDALTAMNEDPDVSVASKEQIAEELYKLEKQKTLIEQNVDAYKALTDAYEEYTHSEMGDVVKNLLEDRKAAEMTGKEFRNLKAAYNNWLNADDENEGVAYKRMTAAYDQWGNAKSERSPSLTKSERYTEALDLGLEDDADIMGKILVTAKNLGSVFSSIGQTALNMGKSIVNGIKRPFEKVGETIGHVGNRIKRLVANVFIFQVVSKALRAISQYMTSVVQKNAEASAAMAKLKAATQALVQPLIKFVLPIFVKIVNIITSIVAKIGSLVASLFGTSWGDSVASAAAISDSMDDTAASAKETKKSLAGFDQINTLDDQSSGGGGGGGSGGAGFAGLADIEQFDFKGLQEKFHNFIQGILQKIYSINWQQLGTDIYNKISDFVHKVDWGQLARDVFELLGAAIGALAGVLWGFLKRMWEDVVKYFKPYIEESGGSVIAGFLKGIWEGIKNIGKWIYDNILLPFWNGLCKAFEAHSPSQLMVKFGRDIIVQGLYNGLKNIWEKVKGLITGLVTNVTTAFSGLWNTITNGARNAWQGIKNAFSSVASFFKSTFSNAWTAVKNIFSAQGFARITDGIGAAFKSLLNRFISGVNNVVAYPFNKIRDAFDTLRYVNIAGVKPFSWLPYITVPQIPYLAKGGLIPPNREFTAVLGDNKTEPEIVSPVSAMKQAFMEAMRDMQMNGNVTVVLEGDAKGIFKVVQKQARAYAAQTGGAAF